MAPEGVGLGVGICERRAGYLLVFGKHVVQNSLHGHDVGTRVMCLIEVARAGERRVLHLDMMLIMSTPKCDFKRVKPDAIRLLGVSASLLHLADQC
jgi:hypothetical protein